MSSIFVREHENFEAALRRFKRAVEKSGVLAEVRRREFFESRSEEKKRAKASAIKRFRKKQGRDKRTGDMSRH